MDKHKYIYQMIEAVYVLSDQPLSLSEKLGKCLDLVFEIPRLPLLRKGAIYLFDEYSKSFQLKISRDISNGLVRAFANVDLSVMLYFSHDDFRLNFSDKPVYGNLPNLFSRGHILLPIMGRNAAVLGFVLLYRDPLSEIAADNDALTLISMVLTSLVRLKQDESRLDLFSHIIENHPAAMAMLDAEGEIEYVNTSFSAITGFEREEVYKKDYHYFSVGEQSESAMREMVDSAKQGKMWEGEILFRKKNGEPIWTSVHVVPLRDDRGILSGYLFVKEEITLRKSSEDALRRSEERYRTLVQNINEYIYSVYYDNGEAVSTYHSPRCFDVTGYTPGDFEEDNNLWINMVHTDDRERVAAFLNNMRNEKHESYIEHRIIHKSGAERWVSNSCAISINQQGQVQRLDGFILDITERRRALADLKKLSVAVEQSPASVVITDTDGIIEYVNPKFTRLTGYTPEEVVGKNPRVLKSGEIPPEGYKAMWDTILSGVEWHGEFHNRKKNGELYWEIASISPVRNSKNVITHFLAVKEDITERKAAQDALRDREEELSRRNELIEKELRYAQQIQRALLPKDVPQSERYSIGYRYIPLEAVGGDYFSFFPWEQGVGIFIGDVAGHGVSAALFLSLLKYITQDSAKQFPDAPGKYLHALNTVLSETQSNYFITAVYAVFDLSNPERPVLKFSNGGHPPLVHYCAATEECTLLFSKGTIIGMFDELEYEEKQLVLAKGDRIFLYTDGIPESRTKSGRILGHDSMGLFIEAATQGTLDETLDSILEAHRSISQDFPQEDDIVIIGIEIL